MLRKEAMEEQRIDVRSFVGLGKVHLKRGGDGPGNSDFSSGSRRAFKNVQQRCISASRSEFLEQFAQARDTFCSMCGRSPADRHRNPSRFARVSSA